MTDHTEGPQKPPVKRSLGVSLIGIFTTFTGGLSALGLLYNGYRLWNPPEVTVFEGLVVFLALSSILLCGAGVGVCLRKETCRLLLLTYLQVSMLGVLFWLVPFLFSLAMTGIPPGPRGDVSKGIALGLTIFLVFAGWFVKKLTSSQTKLEFTPGAFGGDAETSSPDSAFS